MASGNPGPLSRLGSTKSTNRLNQIDKVRANGIGDVVALPQLVVCGDQSSGKSSVLERVTGIPFPQDEGLCTRFPTEIILRHSSETLRLTASIQPNMQRPPEEQKTLLAYRDILTDASDLPKVIAESGKLMGIRGYDPDADHAANAFSHDVLRIEIVGPVGLHLTVVDLPGLISVPTKDQTLNDVHIVQKIAEKYLASTRTIIMAVVQAGNDIVNQRVIQLASKYDNAGDRTVGIITKPDLINAGTQHRIAELAKNKGAVNLKLGFFLVRNPGPSEKNGATDAALPWDEAAQLERTCFDEPVWKEQNLSADRVGIDALRCFLQDFLNGHIEKELPKVRDEIKRLLAMKRKELDAMGIKRQSPNDVRVYLTSISMRFHALAEAALDGNYGGHEDEFFRDPVTRLRATVHEANGEFAETMRVQGQLRKIVDEEYNKTLEATPDIHEENHDGPVGESQMQVTKEEMTAWVRKIYKRTRGRELPGSRNHLLLAELFREQSRLWPSIADDHIKTILEVVTQWTSTATKICAADENTRREIWTLCQGPMEKVRTASMDELQMLVDDEKQHPITYNHYYTDNIQKAREASHKIAIQKAEGELSDLLDSYSKLSSSNARDLVRRMGKSTAPTADMDERACQEALVELAAYYKVATKTFVDNVCRQVVERHVMAALPSFFSPTKVATFSDEELLRIGSETESHQAKRNGLETLVKGLQQSLVDLQGPD